MIHRGSQGGPELYQAEIMLVYHTFNVSMYNTKLVHKGQTFQNLFQNS
jgi:hypothetical protein